MEQSTALPVTVAQIALVVHALPNAIEVALVKKMLSVVKKIRLSIRLKVKWRR